MKHPLLHTMLALCSLVCSASAQTFSTLQRFGDLTYVSGQNPHGPLVQGPDGTLYGTTRSGAQNVQGTVFKLQPDGSGFTVLKWFTNDLEAISPFGGLVLSGDTLYGTTSQGGSSGAGTVFKINTDGTGFTVLKEFAYTDGASPVWALALSGGVLYGTTSEGGNVFFPGTVFKLNTDGTGFAVLKEFAGGDGAIPQSMTVSGNVLYGVTQAGGETDNGIIFKMNTDGTGYSILKHFTGPDGKWPMALTLSGDVIYGSTEAGGNADRGTVFKMNMDGTGFTVLKEFSALAPDTYTNSDGADPGPLVLSGGRLIGGTQWGGNSGNGVLFALNTDGTGFTVLKHYATTEGGGGVRLTPSGSTLYGTTDGGGSFGHGTVFRVSADGTGYTMLRQFTYGDGQTPYGDLALSSGTIYGTTIYGGSYGAGTVFKLKTDGSGYAILKSFTGSGYDSSIQTYTNAEGTGLLGGLTLSGGTLYGAAERDGSLGGGTIFKLNTDGTGFTVLKNFSYYAPNGTNSDGLHPRYALTVTNGVIYGTTSEGGSSYYGTLFRINTDGTGFAVLRHFLFSEGYPYAKLTLSGSVLYGTTRYGPAFKLNTDGTGYTPLAVAATTASVLTASGDVLYGTTEGGGNSGSGAVFRLNTDGTGFTVLKHFGPVGFGAQPTNVDGAFPQGGVTLSGGRLYGTTYWGGASGLGTVFQLNTDGTGFTVLKHLTPHDGQEPAASVLVSGSTLYSTTGGNNAWGPDAAYGTVFKIELSGGLMPIPLIVQRLGGNLILSWTNSAFSLQASPAVTSTFTNIPGAISPYTNALIGPRWFFRLIGN